MKVIFIMVAVSILSGCTSPGYAVKEEMMPNGHWVFGVYTHDTCDQLVSAEKQKNGEAPQQTLDIPILKKKSLSDIIYPQNSSENKQECIELFKKSLTNRSKELCGSEAFSLYGCLNSETSSETSNLRLLSTNGMQEFKLKCYLNCNPK